MMEATVCVIILNWNRSADTLACLDSLDGSVPVVVVDNGSRAEVLEQIRCSRPDVPLLALKTNQGYAGGNNAGIRWALERDFEWVLLLNDDAILAPDALETLVNTANRDPHTGFAGPLVLHAAPAGVVQSAGGRMDSRWRSFHRGLNTVDRGQFDRAETVDWISGCAILARSAMIRQIGMLDERFFMYEEELEWCWRGKQSGWNSLFVPQARIVHAGVSVDYTPKPYITYYMTRNHLLLLSKHHAGWRPWLDAIYQTSRTLTSWTLRPKWRDQRDHRNAMWRAVQDFLKKRWGPMSVQ